MYRATADFHDRLERGERPELYVTIQTHMGVRAYSVETLTDAIDFGAWLLDGTFLLDGSKLLGDGEYMLSKEARVLQYGALQKTIAPAYNDLLTAFSSKRQQSFDVSLDNSDKALTQLMASEPFITRPFAVYLGFDDVAYSNHLKMFSGVVDVVEVTQTQLKISAIES